MNAGTKKLAVELGLRDLPDGLFFSSIDEASLASAREPRLRGQLHHMRRAFDKLELDGILCVDYRPTALFCKRSKPVDKRFINDLQKRAWNQNSATLLIVLDPTRVYLLSCIASPENDDSTEISEHRALVAELHRAADVIESFQLAEQLASGSLYRRHPTVFNASEGVDQYLVGNLEALSEQILGRRSRKNLPAIHAFLGRIIFTAYLLDRNVIHLSDYIRRKNTASLHDFLENIEEEKVVGFLFDKLFPALRKEFNGSMFGAELDDERRLIGRREIRLLRTFFRGDDLGSKQRTLGFWAYDFSVVPVEIISAIYEKFLGLEDPSEKERKGAYYTPKNLAEMTVSEAVQGTRNLTSMRFLDPSCGSGIFLVILFHYLADEWRNENPGASVPKRMEALTRFFTENLRGVDVNGTACRLTCFSLYIALLDQFDPPTLRKLKEEVGKGTRKPLLPLIFGARGDSNKLKQTCSILHADFFEEQIPLGSDFDFIIGNPPWVSRGGSVPNALSEWVNSEENPFREVIGASRAKLYETLIPQKQVAHAFLWKSALHLRKEGQGCLILPSQLLTNQTDSFQRRWFSNFETNRVVHLADFRRFLFDNAIRPCLVFHFRNAAPEECSSFEYAAPKVTGLEPRSGLIPVCADDRKWIQLREILDACERGEAATIWKTRMWASVSDLSLLQALKTLPSISDYAGEPDEGKRWMKGRGFKPWYQIAYDKNPESYGKPKSIPGKLSDSFVRTRDLPLYFVTSRDIISLGSHLTQLVYKGADKSNPKKEELASKKGFHRSPDERLFAAPVLLINKALNDICVSEKKIFYQDAVTGIHGKVDDVDSLYFLAAFLNSSLAEYLSYHLSSSYGIERDEVYVHEILKLPFFLPEESHSPKAKRKTLERMSKAIRDTKSAVEAIEIAEDEGELRLGVTDACEQRETIIARLQEKVACELSKYFELSPQDAAIIEDTVSIYKPSATPESPTKDIPTTRPTSDDDLRIYSEWLTGALNRWASASQSSVDRPTRFRAEFGTISKFDLAVVILRRATKEANPSKITSDTKLNEALGRLAAASREEVGPFEYLRGILHGTPNAIYLAKPALLGQWTRTRALDDANAVFAAILEGVPAR